MGAYVQAGLFDVGGFVMFYCPNMRSCVKTELFMEELLHVIDFILSLSLL